MTGRHTEIAPLLADLFDLLDLEAAIDAGYVRRQYHPDLPLAILNYSELAQFERVWNPVTRQCRGLIYRTDSGRIVARPLPKFFNYGEPGAPVDWDPGEPVIVTEKWDGSLGILFDDDEGGAIATRGSFTSGQARHATELWKRRYAGGHPLPMFHTLLFEIVYPGNRIVCNYGDLDDLVLLGAVDRATGRSTPPSDWPEWSGPAAEQFAYNTLTQALAAESRSGKEGLVVHFTNSDQRVKLKQTDYVALHRILTGVTSRTLWEFLAVNACYPHAEHGKREAGPVDFLVRKLQLAPQRIEEILSVGPDWRTIYLTGVPEEFRDWVERRVTALTAAADAERERITTDFTAVRATTAGDRREFVQAARARTENWRLVMAQLDGRQIETWVWMQVYPPPERAFRNADEAVA